ncbi:Activin_recp domain-containing protein [Caenorhabditis elegans]|uniref:Activin_recp domain-containing protein n=1 Tax=Caenorhabditis elegans TaxID=6239 RepID=A0A8D9MHE1_CAEEL|nr:Activin_recp domain-containing protein [Caenorhabditis elegans]CAG8860234.1 Activin_recp domain-containing protein [Caenorhabditis elegans]
MISRRRGSRIVRFLVFLLCFEATIAITCYDCHSDQGTCNDGECEGVVCIKMETANKADDRRTIHKTCGDEAEEMSCQQSAFGSKWMSRCVCDTPLCNGDQALIDSGLEPSSAAPPAAHYTQFALLVAIIVFVGASCLLILVATVCVQFC